jgi:hypothetical protein
MTSAYFCARQLYGHGDRLVLAAISPAIVAAAAYGLLLVVRSLRSTTGNSPPMDPNSDEHG